MEEFVGKDSANAITAERFAYSWNSLPLGAAYSSAQINEWLSPLTVDELRGIDILDCGCGNGTFAIALAQHGASSVEGIDLGSSVQSARINVARSGVANCTIHQQDLHATTGKQYDLVICIGVLHHLKDPRQGFNAVVSHVKPGGKFHCWVYGREGTTLVRWLVEPIRKLCRQLTGPMVKYCIAWPLAVATFPYALLCNKLKSSSVSLPMKQYFSWIYDNGLKFYLHVACDQLIAYRTTYLSRQALLQWMSENKQIDPDTHYIVNRLGHSWSFGGRISL